MSDSAAEKPEETPAEAPAPEPQAEPAEEPQGQPEAADEAAEPEVKTIDVVAAEEEVPAGTVALHTPKGSLTLRPNQTELDPEQHWALKAIGIDTQEDPQVIPHLRAFVHMCQIRELDPFAREAYLIGRGNGDKRTYTMQTGIDGYRKIANNTGRFIRVVDRLWTGQDADDRSYRPDANGVMRRVWYDQWPARWGPPGAAKVVVEHWDESHSEIVTTEAVADWDMYAPYEDEWEGPRGNRRKTGKRKLNDMWTKGGPHMLAKCAEALAIRMAFPSRTSGLYTHEEMHRLDQAERDRMREEQRRRRLEAQRQRTGAAPLQVVRSEQQPAQEAAGDGEAPAGPLHIGDVADEVVARLQEPQAGAQGAQQGAAASADPTPLYRRELDFQAEVLGMSARALAKRPMLAHKRDVDAFTASQLQPLVEGVRPMVVEALRKAGRSDDARLYEALGPGTVADVDTLFVVDGEVVDDPANDPRLDGDPTAPHEPVVPEGENQCTICGNLVDEEPHPPV